MKGTNVVKINNATLIQALQLWANQTFASPVPSVTGVEADTSGCSFTPGVLELNVTLIVEDKS